MSAFVHQTAVVDEDVVLGEGTKVWHFVHVSSGARIGARCVLGQNVFVGRGVRIGDGVKIQNNVAVYEGVEVGDEVFLGPSCVFTNVLNPRAAVERKSEFKRTKVGKGVTVGANATIMCGYDLGEYCMVGAGAVVPRGVAPYALVIGNPARVIGFVCKCGVRLPEGLPAATTELGCASCGLRYRVAADGCRPLG